MDRARFLRRMIPVLCGAGLLSAAWAQPASAQAYYTCPPGYYAEPGSCVPSGYYYGQPYFYGPSYYGFVPFGFGGGFGHRDFGREGFGREGFGHGRDGFGHGGGGVGHGGGHR